MQISFEGSSSDWLNCCYHCNYCVTFWQFTT